MLSLLAIVPAIEITMLSLCRKGCSEPEIAAVAAQLFAAVAYLHGEGVMHRDLKAGNILLKLDGTIKVTDFGCSHHGAPRRERRSTFIGTPYWMAPEVVACEELEEGGKGPRHTYDCRADVWSGGITLIELAEMVFLATCPHRRLLACACLPRLLNGSVANHPSASGKARPLRAISNALHSHLGSWQVPPNAELHPMQVLIAIKSNPAPRLERPVRSLDLLRSSPDAAFSTRVYRYPAVS